MPGEEDHDEMPSAECPSAIYRRVLRTLNDVRKAVLSFRYDDYRSWQGETLGFMTPLEARQRDENARLRLAAA